MTQNEPNIVTMILAVGSAVTPLFFSMLFFFMFRWFPTRKEIDLQEANQTLRHEENRARFETIERDVKELLKR